MCVCGFVSVDGSLVARQAGRSYGLKVTLDAQQADYLRSMDQYYGAGFRVSLTSCYLIFSHKDLA